MRRFKSVVFVLVVLSTTLPLLAQQGSKGSGNPPPTPQASTPPSTPNSNGTSGAAGAQRRQPCWKVAGISSSAMQQRGNLERNARAEIAAACSDSSLTPQQRRQKIQQIHQQARQAIEALITPQQQEALKACRAARGEGTEASHPQATGTGPCGEVPEPAATPNNSAGSHKFN